MPQKNRKMVVDIDTGIVYGSIYAATKAIGAGKGNIIHQMNGRRMTAKGHRFRYYCPDEETVSTETIPTETQSTEIITE